jgi:hypothetical protein
MMLFDIAHARCPIFVPTVPTFFSNATKRTESQQNNGWNGPSNFSNFVQLIARLIGTAFPTKNRNSFIFVFLN